MGFFKRFTRPRAKLTFKADKHEFYLGEELKGFVEVKSEEEFHMNGIMVGLNCLESVKKTRQVSESDANGKEHWEQEEYWDTAKLSSSSLKACDELHITEGFFLGFPFAFKLPSSGRETFHSIDRNLEWILWAKMENRGRRSTKIRHEIYVTKPSVTQVTQKEVVRELVLIPCKYCGGLMPQTSLFCPNCGARRRA